jgi:hypothetical protein
VDGVETATETGTGTVLGMLAKTMPEIKAMAMMTTMVVARVNDAAHEL